MIKKKRRNRIIPINENVCEDILPKRCFIHKNLEKLYKQKDMTQDNLFKEKWLDDIHSKIK